MSKNIMAQLAKLTPAEREAALNQLGQAPAATPAPAAQHVTAPPPPAQVIQSAAPTGGALSVSIAGQTLATSDLRTFSSGKTGWNLTGKVVVDGRRVQVSGNFVILDRKDN